VKLTEAEIRELEIAHCAGWGVLPTWTPTMEDLINRRLVRLATPSGLSLTDSGLAALQEARER
jgi:hypothetical protein